MAQEIIPDKQSVLSCLKQKVYYVDFYQREYVWTKNTVEVLLNDIFYAFEISYKEHKDEEMSQEVLEKYNWYYLNVFITNKVEGKVFIVDGQQRLSTLTLIATKLYHITNNDNLKDILRDCIFAKDQFKGNVFPDFDKMCTYKITYPNFQAFSKNNLCKWVTQRLFFVSLHHVCT